MSIDFYLGNPASGAGACPPIAALAPMSGISDVGMRRLALRFGAAFAPTEMVAAGGLVRGDEEARLRSERALEGTHVVQLVGRDPVRMAEGARLAEAGGADVIDINFGCPAKKVTGGLAGSALMREPDLAELIVGAVVAAVSVPVTVKMRLGWDAGSANAVDLARRVERIGARAVTVHGRTRQQFYTGQADWVAIAAVTRAVSIPVIANGDVLDCPAADRCLAASEAAGVMIGRGALGQPWIVGEVAAALAGRRWAEPSPQARGDCACEHYEILLAHHGRRVGVRHARKHLAAYADRAHDSGYGLPGPDRHELVTTEEPARALRLLARLYADRGRRAA